MSVIGWLLRYLQPGDYFIVAGGLLYLGAAIFYGLTNKPAWVVVYVCYAGANVGLIWAAHQGA